MGNYGWFFEQARWANTMLDNNNGRGADPAAKVVFDESGGARAVFSVWKKLIDDGVITYLGRGNGDAVRLHLRKHRHHPLESTAALKSLLTNVEATTLRLAPATSPTSTRMTRAASPLAAVPVDAQLDNDAREKALLGVCEIHDLPGRAGLLEC